MRIIGQRLAEKKLGMVDRGEVLGWGLPAIPVTNNHANGDKTIKVNITVIN